MCNSTEADCYFFYSFLPFLSALLWLSGFPYQYPQSPGEIGGKEHSCNLAVIPKSYCDTGEVMNIFFSFSTPPSLSLTLHFHLSLSSSLSLLHSRFFICLRKKKTYYELIPIIMNSLFDNLEADNLQLWFDSSSTQPKSVCGVSGMLVRWDWRHYFVSWYAWSQCHKLYVLCHG